MTPRLSSASTASHSLALHSLGDIGGVHESLALWHNLYDQSATAAGARGNYMKWQMIGIALSCGSSYGVIGCCVDAPNQWKQRELGGRQRCSI